MRKKALWKTVYREILRSPGRFFAIVAIILLGSGFIVGLKDTRDSMVKTGDRFLRETLFYDFAASSTLGYTDKEVEGFAAKEGVTAAEGGIRQDAIVTRTGDKDSIVVAFYTIGETVNVPKLTEGRMPENDSECLGDANGSFRLGDVLTLTEENDEDTMDAFREKEFKIVGIANTPLYLNFERGSTSLGTGKLTAYAFLPSGAFDLDYYTTVYIREDLAGEAWSQEFDDNSDAAEPEIKILAEQMSEQRYTDLVTDAKKKIADGEEQYEEGLLEYRSSRVDAEHQLSDAKDDLEDARRELDDARDEIEEAKETLKQETEDAEQEIADAEKELRRSLIKLNDGETEYADGLAEYEDGEAQYENGLASIDEAKEKITAAKEELLEGKRELADKTAAAEEEIKAGEQALASAKNELDSGEQEYAAGLAEYETGYAQYSEGLAMYQAMEAQFEQLPPEMQAPEMRAQLDGMKAQLDAAAAPLEAAKAQLDAARADLDQGWDEYNAGMEQIASAKAQLDEQTAEAMAQLDAAEEEIRQGETELLEGEQELVSSRTELDDAKAQLEDARAELDRGWRAYYAGAQKIADAKEELATKVSDAEAEIADGEKELEDGEKKYRDGMADYQKARADADKEFADAEQELEDARQELADARKDLDELEPPQTFVIGRWGNVGYAGFDSDSSIVSNVSRVFPIFFFAVAALICMTTVLRMVDEQRGQIGVLMSLGYSRADIMLKYLFYSGSATILGCGIGIPGCSWLFPQILWKAYSIIYLFSPRLVYNLNLPLSMITFLLSLFGMLAVTYFSLRSELRSTPAAELRPKPPKLGKRVFLERIGFLWNRLSFMWKVTLRNIFRYKERVLMMILGIGGCTALMITGYGIRDSIQNVVEYQYSEITLYDYEVLFARDLSETEQDSFLRSAGGYTDGILLVHQESADISGGKAEKEAYLTVIPEQDRLPAFFAMKNGEKEVEYPSEGEAVINNGLADRIGVEEGDTVYLTLDGQRVSLKVSGIFHNYIYNYVFLSEETYRSGFGKEPGIRSAFVLGSEENATTRLYKEKNVLSVTVGSVVQERINSIMGNLIYIVLLTIICAAALAFIVIYDLTNININERMREIATVKVLGFYPGESAIYVLRENILLTILGALVGIPLGILLNNYVVGNIKIDLVYFQPRILWPSFIYATALTILFSLLVDLVMAVKLNKIDMAAALKAAE